jgi:hypothetical protein
MNATFINDQHIEEACNMDEGRSWIQSERPDSK